METQKCKDCELTKSLDDFPFDIENGKRYYRRRCKDCKSRNNRIKYLVDANSPVKASRTKEYQKQYREENRDLLAMKEKAYREAHREEINNRFREWYKVNKDDLNARRRSKTDTGNK